MSLSHIFSCMPKHNRPSRRQRKPVRALPYAVIMHSLIIIYLGYNWGWANILNIKEILKPRNIEYCVYLAIVLLQKRDYDHLPIGVTHLLFYFLKKTLSYHISALFLGQSDKIIKKRKKS